jgi:hypothetical protein
MSALVMCERQPEIAAIDAVHLIRDVGRIELLAIVLLDLVRFSPRCCHLFQKYSWVRLVLSQYSSQ